MGCEATMSDQGCLFSLDISQHGGMAFKKALDTCVRAAELQGERLTGLAAAASVFEINLLATVRRLKHKCSNSKGLDHSLLARLLSEAGYEVRSQAPQIECNCKSKARKCLEKLTHTYLICTAPASLHQPETKLIVEPRLREQFEIANPTEPYKRLLDCLPGEFVGVASKLQTLVEAVSTAMAEAFKAQDMALPPWRRTSAALSKWNLDDRIISFQRHPSVDDALNEKQPLKEHLLNDCNLPDFADHNAFAKTSVAKAQHFLTGSPRYLTSHAAAGLENSIDSCKPKISLLARNLADMATRQKARRSFEGSCGAKTKIKRAPSWDFLACPPSRL